jgi:HTH-type transcriptional regulator/antitoxin HigA
VKATLDRDYARLLEDVQPRVPRSGEENTRLLAEAEKLMRKGEDNLTPTEEALLDTLFAVIHEYERRRYAPGKSTPAEMLRFLMEENNLGTADLPLPASRVSEIASGKREVSKAQAKILAKFFRVSPALFI